MTRSSSCVLSANEMKCYREEGLRLDCGVDRALLKVIKEAAQQPQALLRCIIAVEPETAVGWVVVPLVEGLEPT